MANNKKKKSSWANYVPYAVFILIGAVSGVLLGRYMASDAFAQMRPGQMLLYAALFLVGLYVALYLQIVIHEAGHLLFGLRSGYGFSSFRIGSLMWVKEDGRLRFKRFSIAGTGGQCLMTPPELVDGSMPVVWFNLGGSVMNIAAGLLFLGLYHALGKTSVAAVFSLITSVLGFAFALMNGVPMRFASVSNDGYNAYMLCKDDAACRAFWVQLKMVEQSCKGVRLRDMPAAWFTVPTDEQMQNSMLAAMGVFTCNRLIDEQRFAEADALAARLLEIDSDMIGLHRSLLVCERIYCELIGENRPEAVEALLSKEQQKFMKSMKQYPTVLRTAYALALLAEHDAKKAQDIKTRFDACATKYPYPSDIEAESELIQLAAERA